MIQNKKNLYSQPFDADRPERFPSVCVMVAMDTGSAFALRLVPSLPGAARGGPLGADYALRLVPR